MPFSPRFLSEGVRSFVVGLVMLATLIASLAAAYALSVARHEPWSFYSDHALETKPTVIGNLELNIPERFEPQDPARIAGAPGDNTVLFVDRLAPHRKLWLGPLSDSEPREPVSVLNQALKDLVDTDTAQLLRPTEPVRRFRSGKLTGAWYSGLARVPDGDQLHQMAVLTEDGRRYWMIYLTHMVENPMLVLDAVRLNRQLITSVLGSAVSRHLRDADHADLRAAGVALNHDDPAPDQWLPSGIHAYTEADNYGQEPILLIPDDAAARVRVIRLRGVLDPQLIDTPQPLTPAALLAEHISKIQEHSRNTSEIWSGTVEGAETWRVTYPESDKGIVRQVIYSRVAPGRGVLIEILSEPQTITRTTQWVAPLVTAIRDHWAATASPDSDPAAEARSALSLGKTIVQRQSAGLSDHLTPGWTYHLFHVNSQPVGWQAEKILARGKDPTPEESLPLHGRMIAQWSLGHRRLQLDQQWQASPTGSVYGSTQQWTLHEPDFGSQTVRIERMELNQSRLSLRYLQPTPETQKWSVEAPEALVLPVAENLWPFQWTDFWDSPGAIVWLTRGEKPPQPYWVQSGTLPPEHPATPAAGKILLLRPYMSLDAEMLVFDADGHLTEYRSRRLDNDRNGAQYLVQRVDRSAVINAFPPAHVWLDRLRQENIIQ